MLNPAEFDYSKVCIDKWEPLIFSEEYKHYFIENKDKLLTDELKKKFERGLSTRVEQKVVYGVLLNDKEEIRNF